MNVEFWKKHQNTSLEAAKSMLQKSHTEILKGWLKHFQMMNYFLKAFINGLVEALWVRILSARHQVIIIGL